MWWWYRPTRPPLGTSICESFLSHRQPHRWRNPFRPVLVSCVPFARSFTFFYLFLSRLPSLARLFLVEVELKDTRRLMRSPVLSLILSSFQDFLCDSFRYASGSWEHDTSGCFTSPFYVASFESVSACFAEGPIAVQMFFFFANRSIVFPFSAGLGSSVPLPA